MLAQGWQTFRCLYKRQISFEAYPKIKFNDGCIRNCLNPDIGTTCHQGFSFAYVLHRPVSVLET